MESSHKCYICGSIHNQYFEPNLSDSMEKKSDSFDMPLNLVRKAIALMSHFKTQAYPEGTSSIFGNLFKSGSWCLSLHRIAQFRLIRIAYFAAIVLAVMSSCFDSGNCQSTSTDLLKIAFKKKATNKSDTILFTQVKLSGTDTVFYKNKKTSKVTLPMNPKKKTTTITFQYGNNAKKATINYLTTPILLSEDCGVTLKFKKLKVVSHSFDSVVVVGNQLDSKITTNIVIYQ